MRNTIALAIAPAFIIATTIHAAESGYYSQPALYNDRIVFVSEGDLWTAKLPEQVSEAPIIAYRLTSSEGEEAKPCFSPDGAMIAFSAQYEGNTDVYIMPVDGGVPKRLTYHPSADLPLCWTPDGQAVLFSSPRVNQFGRPELWRVSINGGMPIRYDFGECSMISLTSTGRRAAFTRWSNENWNWKRYRGGTAPEIWIGDLNAAQFAPLTDNPASDMFPMWISGRVYFLSDRSGTMNIFSATDDMNTPEKDVKQHTKFASDPKNPTAIEGYDIRWPSADAQRRGTRIVFCQGAALALLDTNNDSVTRLNVQLASDRVAVRQRFASLDETITEFALSSDGKSILIGSRGDIISIPVETGPVQQLTNTSSAREWGVQPLGKDRLAMISDATGEQEIVTMPVDGSKEPSWVTQDREAWLFPPATSPDGRWIAFADKTLRLHALDLQTLQRQQVDQSEAGEITDYRFSPDSQWLAYTKPMPNGFGSVMIYSLRTGRSFPISSNLYNDSEARWDPAGKYLYFLSERNINPTIGQMDLEYVLTGTTEVYVVPLAASTPPPFKAEAKAAGFDLDDWASPDETDDEKPSEGKKDDNKQDANAAANAGGGKDEATTAPEAMKVDTEGLNQRQYRLPIDAGDLSHLEALWGAVAYLDSPPQGLLDDTWPEPSPPQSDLHRYDIVKDSDKTLAEKTAGYDINSLVDVIAYPKFGDDAKIDGFTVISASGEGEPKQVSVKSQQIHVESPAEWNQIFSEAWRLQRDFYWAPNYVGVDWPAMKSKYAALLPRVGTRQELNDVIGQLIGELGTSHTYIWGGENPRKIKPLRVGLLGADISFDGQGFKIDRIIPGQPWGEDEFNSPLEPAYLNVKPGMYILAINGVKTAPSMDIHELLQDQAEKIVRLMIADEARGTNSRTIQVKTLSNEQPLRYAAWVQSNRRYVEEKSEGKLGYVHIPDMGGEGLSMFSRLFYPQFDKQGIVVDIRDNGGGFVSQMIIERLARKPIAFDQPRQGQIERYPLRSVYGYLATIIDEHAGSDGDIFPESFRILNLGPLIGTRTWGGVVGIRGDKPFVDLGLSTQPEFAWWEPKGGWVVENVGVSPDIKVEITPSDRIANRDPQLDRAIEYLLDKLKTEPMVPPSPPPFPVRVK